MLISVHVLVLNSSRPPARLVRVSRKNGASSFAYCGCVGMGWARMDTVTFGPGARVGCARAEAVVRAAKSSVRTPIRIRRMSASFVSGVAVVVPGRLGSAVHDVNGH